jgi:heptosyltransferase III
VTKPITIKRGAAILVSRTDAIGDVVLTLPLCVELKQRWPEARIVFLGRNYVRDVVALCPAIDAFLAWDEIEKLTLAEQVQVIQAQQIQAVLHVFPRRAIAQLAKAAGIPKRIGTTNRLFHWWTCNRLVRLSRRNSPLHEAELNIRLAVPHLGLVPKSKEELATLTLLRKPEGTFPEESRLDATRFKIILHAKSSNSAREWPMSHWLRLMQLLPESQFQFILTGTEAEQAALQPLREALPASGVDLTGRLSMNQLLCLISRVDALLACSTGPLHLAAALGRHAVGLYPPIKPMHAGRWGPLGKHTKVFSLEKDCSDCRTPGTPCACIQALAPDAVAAYLQACPRLT